MPLGSLYLAASFSWCVWHPIEMHSGIQQPRERKANKNSEKGGLLGPPLFRVLKTAMCLFCCKTHLLHSIVGNMNPGKPYKMSVRRSSPQHADRCPYASLSPPPPPPQKSSLAIWWTASSPKAEVDPYQLHRLTSVHHRHALTPAMHADIVGW